jgi:hypothetical protein
MVFMRNTEIWVMFQDGISMVCGDVNSVCNFGAAISGFV